MYVFLFFKQKTAYELRISDWSSDVCSSDLAATSDEQIQQTAEEILDTGVRPIIADDYDARAVKFGEEIANLPPEDRARLTQELMRQDPGALHSWPEMDIIDRMQNEGLIRQDEFSAIAQGFVDAYKEGRPPQHQAGTFLQVASLTPDAPGEPGERRVGER